MTIEDNSQLRRWAESQDTEDLRQFLTDFRLSSVGANLTKELKEEWRACERYAEKRRKQNWDNRKIGTGVQGMSKDGTRQEQMKLPRLAELKIEKQFGPDWGKNKKAKQWAWDEFPQFRLIDRR